MRAIRILGTRPYHTLPDDSTFETSFWPSLTKFPVGLFFGLFVVLEVIVLLSSEKNVHHGCNTFRSQAEEKRERYLGDGILTPSL